MLYLIKGSRVREYFRQNVDILSAPERAPFKVSYSHRWIQSGLRPVENDGAVIVFADSPYERFAPVRFAVIEHVEDSDGRIVLQGRLGPFVSTDDPGRLSARWSAISEEDPEKPGRFKFLVSDENVGLGTPDSPVANDLAWRSAIDSLSTNSFLAETTVARLVQASCDGRELDSGAAVAVGSVVEFEVELRSPHRTDEVFAPSLVCDPDGAAELVEQVGTNRLPSEGTGVARVRVVEPGLIELKVGVAGRSLTSSWVRFPLEVRGERFKRVESVTHSGGTVDVSSLARFLARNSKIDDNVWLELLDDYLIPARPEDPLLLGLLADHAWALDRHDLAMRALDQIGERSPSQQTRLLIAAVTLGANDRLIDLLDETDLATGDDFESFLLAVANAPEATIDAIVRSELRDRRFGDERQARLVVKVWPRLSSVELMCSAAEAVAYLDPDAGARLLLDKWANPSQMPDEAIDLLLDWKAQKHLLGPYVRERLRRASERDDIERIEASIDNFDSVSRGDRPSLLIDAGKVLLAAGDMFVSERGLGFCEQGVHQALENDQVSLAVDSVAMLRSVTATRGNDVRARVARLDELVNSAILESDELQRWEQMRSTRRADLLRPRTAGRRLFAIGGKPLDGFEALARDLGLADHRWVETDKDKSTKHDWANGLGDRDIVLAVLPWIGHADSSVKDKVLRKGAKFELVHHNPMSLLDGIERALGSE